MLDIDVVYHQGAELALGGTPDNPPSIAVRVPFVLLLTRELLKSPHDE